MDDQDLERRLAARLHARFDRAEPSAALAREIDDARVRAGSTSRRPAMWSLLAGVAAVAVIAVALGAGRGLGFIGAGAGPSTAPPSAAPSPTPVAPETQVPTVAPTLAGPVACRAADLTAVDTLVDGGAGSRFTTVSIKNVGGSPCLLYATPRFELVDSTGTLLVASKSSSGTIVAGTGSTWSTDLQFTNWCGPAFKTPVTLELVAVGGLVAVTGPSLATADGPPPCNGPTLPPSLSAKPLVKG